VGPAVGAAVGPQFPDLAGRVAVVTGGSRGIGAATCRLLAANGVRVVAVGRDATPLNALVNEIRWGGGVASAVRADCTDPAALAALRERAVAEYGEVDIVMAFAGGAGEPRPTVDLTPEDWRRVLDIDLTATFLTVRTFLPDLLDRGTGAVVTMSSAAGRQPSQANAAYAVAKAGVAMFTRHLAAEVAARGVRVNCLAPSAVVNETMTAGLPAARMRELGASFPLGRLGTPDDVAAAAAFLASDASSWITGVTLDVAGGKIIL
jgi:3-oxoacyl-[acyl-carrier protein] reductase